MGEKVSDSCSMCTVPLVSGDQMNVHVYQLPGSNLTFYFYKIAQLHIAHVPSTNDRVPY